MKQFCASMICVLIVSISFAAIRQNETTSTTLSKYVSVTKYDPKRDAGADIRDAVVEAKRSGRNVLVDVGGEWCSWCHTLDRFFDQNKDLREQLDQNFVLVKINYSPENKNEKLLSRYPTIPGFPHLFVLDGNGKLLHSQDTSELEQGKSYNHDKFVAFLKRWSPRS
jgi:thioredoxin-related protein